jgi:hypothetical protein
MVEEVEDAGRLLLHDRQGLRREDPEVPRLEGRGEERLAEAGGPCRVGGFGDAPNDGADGDQQEDEGTDESLESARPPPALALSWPQRGHENEARDDEGHPQSVRVLREGPRQRTRPTEGDGGGLQDGADGEGEEEPRGGLFWKVAKSREQQDRGQEDEQSESPRIREGPGENANEGVHELRGSARSEARHPRRGREEDQRESQEACRRRDRPGSRAACDESPHHQGENGRGERDDDIRHVHERGQRERHGEKESTAVEGAGTDREQAHMQGLADEVLDSAVGEQVEGGGGQRAEGREDYEQAASRVTRLAGGEKGEHHAQFERPEDRGHHHLDPGFPPASHLEQSPRQESLIEQVVLVLRMERHLPRP